MDVNLSKTKIMVFRNGGYLRKYEKWFFTGQRVESVKHYNYLGMLFSSRLSWSPAKSNLAAKATKALHSIQVVIRRFGRMSIANSFKLFDTIVVPVLCYGSEIWGHEFSENIERVQIKFCRFLTGVNSSVNKQAVLGECGRHPLCIFYFKRCISYWLKLIEMENTRYPRACYLMLKRLDDAGRVTWVTSIKNLLFRYGFGIVWLEQQVGNSTIFLQNFTQRLQDCCKQEWHNDITSSSRLSLYCEFKSLLQPERYLNYLSPSRKRILANFRCSTHKLNIEIGRHLNLPLQQRICVYCKNFRNVVTVENEFHFIFICPLYDDIRNTYLPISWRTNVHRNKLVELLASQNQNTISQLSLYLLHAFKRREDLPVLRI